MEQIGIAIVECLQRRGIAVRYPPRQPPIGRDIESVSQGSGQALSLST